MSGHCRVFMGSSGEGDKRGILEALRTQLIAEIGQEMLLEKWASAFGVGDFTLDALETSTQTSDFAIMVMTADDLVESRETIASAPRDNVVFELGLFTSALGRARCVILLEELPGKPPLKLPSDLLGLTTARFTWPGKEASADVKALALQSPCEKIIAMTRKLGPRYKPSKDSLAAQKGIRAFCESVEGMWWQRIRRDSGTALSFFSVNLDVMYNTVNLSGKGYDIEGKHVAHWNSVLTRPEKDKNAVLYYWEGWHPDARVKDGRFSGFGSMNFEPVADGQVGSGHGRFWAIDESKPRNTIIKAFDLRRILNKEIISEMRSERCETKRLLVRDTLEGWESG